MADHPEPPELEITDSVPEGLRVTTDQPYHVLLVSNFAGSDAGTVSGPLSKGVVNAAADSLGELMQTARPTVAYKTTDPLASGNVMAEVNITFDSLKAFDPKNLVGQIPAAKSLAAVRERIVNRLHGKLSPEALSAAVATAVAADNGIEWLQQSLEWTPAPKAADPDAVDDLLGQLDLGGESGEESTPAPKSPIGKIVAAAADGSTIPMEEASALRRTLAEVDRRISSWLTTVLHSPQVQSVESAWRSLAFLMSQMDFRKGLRLSLLHTADGELLERIRTMLIDPVFDEGVDAPALIVVDHQFGNSAPDVEALDELAQHAASLPAVALAGISPQFFGARFAWQIATLPTIRNVFDQWQFAKWKTLRSQPYARSLGVVFGRCLLRIPYGQRNGNVLDPRAAAGGVDFFYREPCAGDKDFVWANGPIGAATTIVRSVADSGWPTAMSGYVHGRVEGFKTAMGDKKGDKKFGPGDSPLPQAKIEELGIVGINAVAGIPNHDHMLVWNGLTAARVSRDDANALLEVSLPYQLFAARLSVLLFALKPHLVGMSPEKLVPLVTQHICDWLPFEGEPTAEQVSVQTRPSEESPGTLELAVTVTPPSAVLPGAIPVVMGYRLG